MTVEVLKDGETHPIFPPGFNLPDCGSCGDVEEECVLGCRLYFDPSLHPDRPKPTPPPDVPVPRAPWPNPDATTKFNISTAFSSHMVLQRAPAKAGIYGVLVDDDENDNVVTVSVVNNDDSTSYTVQTAATGGRWKVFLRPSDAGTNVNITVENGNDTITLVDVIFGDVWFCAGQSNMWLPLQYTYSHNRSFDAVRSGQYPHLRIMAGDSQINSLNPTVPPTFPWRTARDALTSQHLVDFSSTCFYFGEELMKRTNHTVPIGLLAMAIGGSQIEEWIPTEVALQCYGSDTQQHNHILWDVNTIPFVNMTVKGFLWYQGENNAGGLHGNSAYDAGYGCLMPALIDTWRDAWSVESGTTDANAPFGIVGISPGDSEGASDLGSFRWSQTANYGVVPNARMKNVFYAHTYDLGDVWAFCNASHDSPCSNCHDIDPLYDCHQPFYMGPSLHPRLKQPVGARLAHAALSVAYGSKDPVSGPTIAGCVMNGSSLTISFDTHSAHHFVDVQDYDHAFPNRSAFAVQNESTQTWLAVNIAKGSDNNTIVVDVPNDVTVSAIKYAWGENDGPPNGSDVVCCAAADPRAGDECKPFQCPIITIVPSAPFAGLPADPFLAKIDNGRCACPAPQSC